MSITTIRPKIYASAAPALSSLFDQRKTLLAQMAALDKSIMAEVIKTPDYAFIKGISSGAVPPMEVEADHVVFTMNAYNLDQRNLVKGNPPPPYVPSLSDMLGQSTLNMLLNGPLLSKEEKRRALKKLLPSGIMDATKEDPASDNEATDF